MEFADAKRFVMPLGKYKGQTLYDIHHDDQGLKYLDWLVGQDWIHGRTREAIEAFLSNPVIGDRLNALLEDD